MPLLPRFWPSKPLVSTGVRHSTCSWISQKRCLVLLRDTVGGAYSPLAFFPLAWQPFRFCLPFAWAMYVPLRIDLGSVELAGRSLAPPAALLCQAGFTALWGLLIWGFHRLALRRYLAAGG